MQTALISVIIPVYKVEKYLDRCVQSILRQTYKNMELILVDDGSPDKCGEMCDMYAEMYPNVVCVHKANGGLASARNAGMRIAKGDFVGFVDSDDWVSCDMYEYLYNLIKNNCAESATIALKMVYSDNDEFSQPKEKIAVYSEKEILQYYLSKTTASGGYSVCGCLFEKKILEGIYFREGKINEDIDFKYKALEKCKNFVVSNLYKYFYFQSTGSITTSGLRNRDFQLYEAANALVDLTSKESYGSIARLGKVKQARTAFSLLSKIAYYGYSDEIVDKIEVEKNLIAEHRKNVMILLNSPIPISRKLLATMYAINFHFSKKIVSLVKKLNIA